VSAAGARSILVTGASAGIGRAATLALLQAGFRVFAGVRSAGAAALLRGAVPGDCVTRLETLELDVTSDAQIQAAVERVAARVGQAGLWGLFNNAGMSVAGPLEYVTNDELRRQLEVNVVGQLAVTRALLPLLRRARGRIVTTGSTQGFVAVAGLGAYCMSKYAMEAFSDTLRRELRPWGIEVALLQPGSIATDIWGKGLAEFDDLMRKPPAGLVENYGGLLTAARELALDSARRASPAAAVARAVVHAFTARRPRTRYCMGTDASVQRWLARLPDRWVDTLLAKMLHWG